MPVFKRYIISVDVIICLLCLTVVGWADNIPIRYTAPLSDGQIVSRISQLSQRIDKAEIADSIGLFLEAQGYWGNAVVLQGDTVIISTDARYKIGEIEVVTVSATGTITNHIESMWNGIVATVDNVRAMKSAILRTFHEKGHYFASLQVVSVALNNNVARFKIKIITGPVVTFARVRFKNLTKTNPDFLKKLCGLSEGMVVNSERISKATRRLDALEYIYVDSLPRIVPSINYQTVEAVFFVHESERNILELGGGYLPAQANQSGQFVGKINYRSENLFGEGRKIGLLYDKRDRNISVVDFSFTQPIFVPEYFELTAHANQTDYDSSYHSFMAELSAKLVTGEHTRLSGKLSWTKTEPQFSFQDPTRTITGGFGYEMKTIRSFNPRSGNIFAIDASYIRRKSWPDSIPSSIIVNESALSVAIDCYQPFYRKLILRFHLVGHILFTNRDKIPYSELYKVGGSGSLRGYRQDEFAGYRLLLLQHEIRFRPSSASAMYLFGDVAYIYSHKVAFKNSAGVDETVRAGGGFGLLFGSKTAFATVEIGWGRHDTFNTGKVHLGVTTLF